MKKHDFLSFLEDILQSNLVKDYCPNGLQVDGTDDICSVMTGVTASQALIDRAIEQKVDALLVHHGFFWKGESQVITGIKKNRIKSLLDNNINLIAYHLPLDIHPIYGNNAQLAKVLGLQNVRAHQMAEPKGIVMMGELTTEVDKKGLSELVAAKLARQCLFIDGSSKSRVKKLGWCTGGGQSYIDSFTSADIDVFISGEISEQTTHSARELGIDFISAGHHATERYGVKALGEHIANMTDIRVEFVDIPNPA
ncbi:Nif3-like dinuclear metal center hexameric protein [Glaciecola sp. MH2013]|nr:Nif3-like dinuclear metal center hexameric protein [Glaciecola sp. MH2013]MBF7072700.1 Nif3-like dinuclear metal center hexameric protein [Glaciecola sp. MH2013]